MVVQVIQDVPLDNFVPMDSVSRVMQEVNARHAIDSRLTGQILECVLSVQQIPNVQMDTRVFITHVAM